MISIAYTAKKGLYLVGDEKGAWMADTTAETLVGSNIKTDDSSQSGTITGATTPWYSNEVLAQYSIASSVIAAACSSWESIRIDCSLTTGTHYMMKVNVATYTSGTLILTLGSSTVNITAVGDYFIAADAITAWAQVGSSTFNGTFTVDFVRLAVPDLSINANGLGVYGSIIKSEVNTNCETMAYSGFSASNYLEQPHNANMDFGTGDFTVGMWVYPTTGGTYKCYVELGDDVAANEWAGNGFLTCTLGTDTDFITGTHIGNTADTATYQWILDEWNFVVMTRISGVLYTYLAAALLGSKANTQDIYTTVETLQFGRRHSSTNTWALSGGQKLTLPRVLDYGLTAAQILSIYNSEKELFRPERVYTQVDNSYSFDLDASALTPSSKTIKRFQESLGGVKSTLVHREDEMWDVTTLPVTGIEVDRIKRFLSSTAEGGIFTFDPNGTIAAPYDPVPCYMEGESFPANRLVNTDYFSCTFKVRAA